MKFYVIGIDDNQNQEFSSEVNHIIQSNSIFSGGKRHYEIVKEYLPTAHQWIDIVVPLSDVFKQYESCENIVVFASGDPLFFGFANTIKREVPDAEIILYPYFNSLQLLAHRLVLPYHDMHIVSLTGRPWDKFDEALISGYAKIGILTDKKNHTPSTIAQRMLDFGYDNYTMTVGELLGNKEEENTSTWNIKDIIGKEFKFPNNIILQQTYKRNKPFGLPNEKCHLLDGRVNMITKMPIRLLSLSMLDLWNKETLWDVGFCTGSVSIEAKLQFPHLKVIAFEIREEGRELIDANAKLWGTPGIESYIGDFTLKDISELPRPDAVFIGGHGGKMNHIIQKIAPILADNGVIVFNSVSENSQSLFREAIQENNLTLQESTSIQIDNYNTILVMKAIKNK
ncbi:precorrin-6y C5,15-methyltransferase (decarboxylating) subunit CbiE [Bacteroides coprosuis]|uniref:precorrin-6y C5,15-methyltransferase (decarboxylating) subunit CbiE n=1 Tax=Bacteroides coprosuis TaxID=151276 RepID=UPI001D336E0B|nr:precorrin-6y C5,15-methyltransferase (decarboxylating) subunit CbiE [Bacteroides coprosuis]HJD93180.1 precorrin-6y C5,15-methyltransferase (decarboxylating) subunit CbiE [Bacteroides coprosuis]